MGVEVIGPANDRAVHVGWGVLERGAGQFGQRLLKALFVEYTERDVNLRGVDALGRRAAVAAGEGEARWGVGITGDLLRAVRARPHAGTRRLHRRGCARRPSGAGSSRPDGAPAGAGRTRDAGRTAGRGDAVARRRTAGRLTAGRARAVPVGPGHDVGAVHFGRDQQGHDHEQCREGRERAVAAEAPLPRWEVGARRVGRRGLNGHRYSSNIESLRWARRILRRSPSARAASRASPLSPTTARAPPRVPWAAAKAGASSWGPPAEVPAAVPGGALGPGDPGGGTPTPRPAVA